MRRVLLFLSLALLVTLALPLEAHMKLAKSAPAANATLNSKPAQLQVWFTQAPDPAVSKLELSGPSGAVTLAAVQPAADKSLTAAIEGAMTDGVYTVRWQSAGDDGHIQKGEFTFTLRQTD